MNMIKEAGAKKGGGKSRKRMDDFGGMRMKEKREEQRIYLIR